MENWRKKGVEGGATSCPKRIEATRHPTLLSHTSRRDIESIQTWLHSNIAARNLFSEENVKIEKPLQEVDFHVEVTSKVKSSSKTPVQ